MAQKNIKAVKWYDGTKAKKIDGLCKEFLNAEAIFNNAKDVYDSLKKEIFNEAEAIKGLHQANNYQFTYVMPKDTVTIELDKLVNLYPQIASDERIYTRVIDVEMFKKLYPVEANTQELYKVTRKGTNYIKDIKAID